MDRNANALCGIPFPARRSAYLLFVRLMYFCIRFAYNAIRDACLRPVYTPCDLCISVPPVGLEPTTR
jgi:hypothetical protein